MLWVADLYSGALSNLLCILEPAVTQTCNIAARTLHFPSLTMEVKSFACMSENKRRQGTNINSSSNMLFFRGEGSITLLL